MYMVKKFINNFGKKYKNFIIKNTKFTKNELLKKSVLDIGTGDGMYVYALSPYVKTIYGIDNNKKILDKARKRNRIFKYNNIRFYNKSLPNLLFKRKFDIILLNNILRFVKVYPTLNQVLNILSDNGILIIQLPLSFPRPIDSRLDKKSDNFDKKLLIREIKAWENVRKLVKSFFKNYNKLYEESNKNRYLIIIEKVENSSV